MRQFECNPVKLCEDHYCCRSNTTTPLLSVGDYFRLSQATGEPMTDIWLTKGDISILAFDMPQSNIVRLGLGLLHEPCPYLGEEGCSVYDARPHGCISFPLVALSKGELSKCYSHLRCTKGITVTSKQKKTVDLLINLAESEYNADLEYFYKRETYTSLPLDCGGAIMLLIRAIEQQDSIDPEHIQPASHRLVREGEAFMERVKRSKEEAVGIDVNEYVAYLQPIYYAFFQQQFAENFDSLSSEAMDFYAASTRRVDELLRGSPDI